MELLIVGFLLCALGIIVVLFLRVTLKTEEQISSLKHKLDRTAIELVELKQQVDDNRKIDEIADQILASVNDKLR